MPATTSGAAMLTDHYELTMLATALADGTASRPTVFEVFARSLPEGHGWGVVAGLERLLDLLGTFRFSGDELTYLGSFLPDVVVDHLATWRFTGSIDAYAEGEVYVPGSPVLTVRADLASGLVLETLVLSVLNHDSAVASKAARIALAAGDRPVIEMGSRRTHEQAAVAAARAAWIAGFASTSNLAAGHRWGVPTAGTAAHAWTLAHPGDDGELAAFATQLRVMGGDTTLLVDTYDITRGIRRAVVAANDAGLSGPGAIRIDAGDLGEEARRARRQLDDLGAMTTRIVVSSDLDEYAIADLRGDPVDGFGVGTRVVTDLTPPGFVYKLVAVGDGAGTLHPVAKDSPGKAMIAGRKVAWRAYDREGTAVHEVVQRATGDADPVPPTPRVRRLDRPVVVAGERVDHHDTRDARRRRAASVAELPADQRHGDDVATHAITLDQHPRPERLPA